MHRLHILWKIGSPLFWRMHILIFLRKAIAWWTEINTEKNPTNHSLYFCWSTLLLIRYNRWNERKSTWIERMNAFKIYIRWTNQRFIANYPLYFNSTLIWCFCLPSQLSFYFFPPSVSLCFISSFPNFNTSLVQYLSSISILHQSSREIMKVIL